MNRNPTRIGRYYHPRRLALILFSTLVVGVGVGGCVEKQSAPCTAAACSSSVELVLLGPDDQVVYDAAGEIEVEGQILTFGCGSRPSGDSSHDCYSEGVEIFGDELIGINKVDTITIDVSAIDASGESLVWTGQKELSFGTERPNGPTCGPVCYRGTAEIRLESP